MARDQPLLVEFSQYAALRAVSGMMHCFDVDQNLQTAAGVGRAFYRISAARRERAITNIARCFPDWSHERVTDTARRSMEHMFRLFMVDAMATPRMLTRRSWPDHVKIRSLGQMHDRLVQREPALLLTGHCGNWELLGQVLALFGYPPTALARPMDNRFINRWLMGMRASNGIRVITKWGATPIVQEILEQGGQIGIIADQNAGDGGLFVPFFGRLASCYKSVGLLALRYNVPIAAGVAHRIGDRMQYEISCVDYFDPSDWADQPDPLFYITARFSRAMETMIRRAPEQYLWVHRRWKSRPRHERQGKPVPQSMIEKLHTLPWLSSDDVEKIVDDSNRLASGHAPV